MLQHNAHILGIAFPLNVNIHFFHFFLKYILIAYSKGNWHPSTCIFSIFCAVFLDLKKPFNAVKHQILLSKI